VLREAGQLLDARPPPGTVGAIRVVSSRFRLNRGSVLVAEITRSPTEKVAGLGTTCKRCREGREGKGRQVPGEGRVTISTQAVGRDEGRALSL
jgi:hypothetical protein